VIVGVIYRHPKSNLMKFQEATENNLEQINFFNSVTYYILGDINIVSLKQMIMLILSTI